MREKDKYSSGPNKDVMHVSIIHCCDLWV